MTVGISPYPGALGTVIPASPARFAPGGERRYNLNGGGLGDGVMVAISSGVAVGGMASSALGGALIGGLASAKWSGAVTGALVSGGLAGFAGGLGASAMSAETGESALPGLLVAGAGAGLFGWGIWRWNKLRKGGR